MLSCLWRQNVNTLSVIRWDGTVDRVAVEFGNGSGVSYSCHRIEITASHQFITMGFMQLL